LRQRVNRPRGAAPGAATKTGGKPVGRVA
jgi:hypothetical protein